MAEHASRSPLKEQGSMHADNRVARLCLTTLVIFLCLVSTACGFLFSHAPPEGHERMNSFTCTEGDAGPILDIVWAGLNVLGALAAASDPNAYENSGQIVAVGLSWGVVSSAAAAVGFDKSRKCRSAKTLLGERLGRGPVAPSPQVDAASPAAVVISPAADTLRVGARVQLIAAAHNSSGVVVLNRAFFWTSSNDAIASVSGAGLVTATAPGAVVIAARTGNVVGTARVLVLGP